MEVQVTDTFGLEEDVIVSIRCGSVRRQAPLESVQSHPFKFPPQLEDVSEPLKIDLLKPVASTRLVLHPAEEQYSIGFEQDDSIAMGLHVMAGAPEASESTTVGAKDTGAKDSASSAKDYLEQNGLLKYVQSLLQAIIQDKPEDPFSYMIEQLSAAQSASIACERAMSRPTSAMRRPAALAGSGPPSARQTPPKQKMVAQSSAPKEEVPLPSQLVDDMPAEPSPVTAVAVPAKPVQTTRPEVEALRENIRAKVEQSLANGVLEQGLVTLQRKKSQEPGGPAAPATTAPTAQPEQPAPKSSTAEEEEEDLEKVHQKLRSMMVEAANSGGLPCHITTDQRPRGNCR